MATSGSSDYNLTRELIVSHALTLVGRKGEGQTVSTETTTWATVALNMMIKTWQADGVQMWRTTDGNVALVAGQTSYSMGTAGDVLYRPVSMHEVRYRDSDAIDVPMQRLTRGEYMELSNKASTGIPSAWFYDPQRDPAKLYVWPTLATGITGSTLRFSYSRRVEDFDTDANDPDFPQEWLEPLVYGLAVRLARTPGQRALIGNPQDPTTIAGIALRSYAIVRNSAHEGESVYFEPDLYAYR